MRKFHVVDSVEHQESRDLEEIAAPRLKRGLSGERHIESGIADDADGLGTVMCTETSEWIREGVHGLAYRLLKRATATGDFAALFVGRGDRQRRVR